MENMMFIVYTTIYDYSATSTLYSLLSWLLICIDIIIITTTTTTTTTTK